MTIANNPSSEICQLALQAAPSGIMVADDRGEIRYVNQTLADMFGYTTEELYGQPIEILLPRQYASSHRDHVKKYVHNPELRSMGSGRDLEGICKNNRRFPVEIGLRPAQTSHGRVVVATVIDITQRKAIEDKLRQHEEQLEELVDERTRELHEAHLEKERMLDQLIQAEKMTAVGTLVSGIGHEINNPLYVLFSAAEAVTDEKDLTQCHRYGNEILKQAKNIAETVKSLSRYAQPGSRHDLEQVDLKKSINEAVHLAQRTLRADQIEFNITSCSVSRIPARTEEIQQVMFNIVRNAIQAITGSGQIKIDLSQQDKWIKIYIQDSGPGIPDEQLKQIFDPFFTTKGPDEGEGLGLYIVRQIITRYQGTIDVENITAGGTRFVIRFPVNSENNNPEEHQ